MRTLQELYTLLLKEFKKKHYPGICSAITSLYCDDLISYSELKLLDKDFNKPSSDIRNRFKISKNNMYWWPAFDKEPRIKYLKYLIDINSVDDTKLTKKDIIMVIFIILLMVIAFCTISYLYSN